MRFLLGLCLTLSSAWSRSVVFIGDSLTEGYGLTVEEAYPAQLQLLLHAQGKKDVLVINGGVSGSTTASATQRVKWFLRARPAPELMVLALGANDGLRGLAVTASRQNLAQAIAVARSAKVKVLLASMKLPTNYGESYRREFEKMYQELARSERVPLLGFLLENVGGVAALNQSDGIHPNAEGQKKIAQNMLKAIGPHL